MLTNLMVGAQYCTETNCEYQELQLEPSAFHAVRTYTVTEMGATNPDTTDTTPYSEPLPMTSLFRLNLFGLGASVLHAGDFDAGVEAVKATVASDGAHTASAGNGETEQDDLLVSNSVEMA
jgi:hypothetical protein